MRIEVVPGVSATCAEVGRAWSVLDHGELETVQTWGDDALCVSAARISKGRHARGIAAAHGPSGLSDGDIELIDYLVRNHHTSPFEHAGATFRVKAPIFVLRQWHRHRTQAYNEISGRYSKLPTETYIPAVERLTPQSATNKQGSGCGDCVEDAGWIRGAMEYHKQGAEYFYEQFTTDRPAEDGDGDPCPPIANETARLILSVAQYSEMYATANLLNWFRFVQLRDDEHAQPEIRVYAAAISAELAAAFPITYAAFTRHWMKATSVSEGSAAVIRGLVRALAEAGNTEIAAILDGLAAQKDKIGRRDVEDVRRLLRP